MFCIHCGNKITNDDKFCSKCGKDLTTMEDLSKCPKCETERNDGNFCTKCGYEYQSHTHMSGISKPKDNTIFNIYLIGSIAVGCILLVLAIYYSS